MTRAEALTAAGQKRATALREHARGRPVEIRGRPRPDPDLWSRKRL
jgi:hypothetical protein